MQHDLYTDGFALARVKNCVLHTNTVVAHEHTVTTATTYNNNNNNNNDSKSKTRGENTN